VEGQERLKKRGVREKGPEGESLRNSKSGEKLIAQGEG